jgi:hypothetical protein
MRLRAFARLGDSAERSRYIETLPRRGYWFIALVDPGDVPAPSGAAASAPPAALPRHPRLTKSHARPSDASFAFATTVLGVLAIVLVRRGERAIWIAQPTRATHLMAALGALGLVFGAYTQTPTCSIVGTSLLADSGMTCV